MTNPVEDCLHFFQKSVPNPANKNLHTQIGVHFEEIVEMLAEITPVTPYAMDLVQEAKNAMHTLATYLKQNNDKIVIRPKDRVAFLDSLCDQFVTAIGTGHMLGMEMSGAIDDVNDSNLSKFDDTGDPIFDENQKVIKGPNYRAPQLERFV
jgi:predicted HAD superfamily Cof-like phosphohydrolase